MKKRIIIIITILGLLTTLGLSYAYFKTRIEGEGTPISASAKELKIIYTDTLSLSGVNIEPGWSDSKTFSVKNEGKETYKYNIIFKNLINTFVTEGFLQYKITCTSNNGYSMTEYKDIPKNPTASDKALATNIEIEEGVTQTYLIEFIYRNSEEDQSDDMGQTLSGSLSIEENFINPGSFLGKILADNPQDNITERTDFTNIETETKLWKTQDNQGISYYFTGNPNNWVSFAGKLWRIIRINGDGSARILYAGTGGEDGYIGSQQAYNTNNDPMYVGWKYGTSGNLESNRTNENKSDAYTTLENWFNSLSSSEKSYINMNAIYCNDRNIIEGEYSTSNAFYYSGYTRFLTNKNAPTLSCHTSDQFKDGFGLMTADEVVMAGGLYGTDNSGVYYDLNKDGGSATGSYWWWTMSPYYWNSVNADMFMVWSTHGLGHMANTYVYNPNGVIRPVISLKSSLIITDGDGTSNNPYVVSSL